MEFTSDRKRMSVLVKDKTNGGMYKLYSKGADSIIESRLDKSQIIPSIYEKGQEFLHDASIVGFRTLMMAMRIFSEEESEEIEARLSEIRGNIESRDRELEKYYQELERELVYVGCSAVEDKLQDSVPEVIADLQKGGISVWMLTGDKLETAQNIGKSCRLITPEMTQYIVDYSDESKLMKFLGDRELEFGEKRNPEKEVMLLNTNALNTLLGVGTKELKHRFITFAMRCTGIICCRAHPGQKAEVVKAMKERCKGEITLAIGDGANDVSMILEAHIGIYIIYIYYILYIYIYRGRDLREGRGKSSTNSRLCLGGV